MAILSLLYPGDNMYKINKYNQEFFKPFKEHAFIMMGLLLLCMCYVVNLQVTAPEIQQATKYKSFINETIQNGAMPTYIDKQHLNTQDVEMLTSEILEIGSLQQKNPGLSNEWFNKYRLSLAKNLYDMKQNENLFLDQSAKTMISNSPKLLLLNSFVILNENSFMILLTMFSLFSYYFIYLLNYHFMYHRSRYDNRLPYKLFSVSYFVLSNEYTEKSKNDFKVNLMFLSFMIVFILNMGVFPLFLTF